MVKARDMVELASSLNAKLTAQEEQRARLSALHPELAIGAASDEPEEAKFIRSSLSQLGLQSTAITADMVKNEREWFEQLAKELGSILVQSDREGLMHDRGIVGLDEIWGGWNRARGVGTYCSPVHIQLLHSFQNSLLSFVQKKKSSLIIIIYISPQP